MTELHFPWLSLLVLIPLVGAASVSVIRDSDIARQWCLGFAVATLLCAIAAWQDFVWSGASVAGGPWGGLSLFAGRELFVIDQLSSPLLPLVALLYLLTAIATLRTKIRRFSFTWTLVSEAIVLATLSCRESWAVIILLILGTLPAYFELRARRKPTNVYVLHMTAFAVAMVGGWLLVTVQPHSRLAPAWAIAPLTLAFLIRCGIAPFHCWATDLFEHATFGTALLFVAPMLGEYGAMRLLVPIAPTEVLHAIALASVATAVYAAGMALVQRESRRFFCYLFLSHSALVLVGLDTDSPIGLTGGLCVWLSVALSLTGLGLTLRSLEARHGRLSLVTYRGVYDHTPALAICFLLTGMASVGFPGTFGFFGTELLVDGAVQTFPYIGIAVVVAAAINGIAVLKAYFLLFTGTRHVSGVPLQIGLRERIAVLTLAALILGGGIFPQAIVLSRHQAAVEVLRQRRALAAAPRDSKSPGLALRRQAQSRHMAPPTVATTP